MDTLKDLEKLLKLCRKFGVDEIKFGSVELKLGEQPSQPTSSQVQSIESVSENPYENFPTGELSPEQLMFYSAGGRPEDDPYIKEQ